MLLCESQASLQFVRGPPPPHWPPSNPDVELGCLAVPGAAVDLQLVARHGLVVTRPEAELHRTDTGVSRH